MTLQQLEYIVAVERTGQFIKAASQCSVTQSTLSAMIQKLESELDVVIFDRATKPISPTPQGQEILNQAKVILYNVAQLRESLLSVREQESGQLRIGIIPTIAPYIVPRLISFLRESYPSIIHSIVEARTSVLVEELHNAEIDMALMATPIGDDSLLEVPVYYEDFVAYISPDSVDMLSSEELQSSGLTSENLWVLQEGHCLRSQVLDICGSKSGGASVVYEAGSIDTLVRIVESNGGYTLIPQLHVQLLRSEQQQYLRRVVSPCPNREVSLVVRRDFVRERMLNIVAEGVKTIVPTEMLDSRLQKYRIRI